MKLHRDFFFLVGFQLPSTDAVSFTRPGLIGGIHRGGSTILNDENRNESNSTPLFALNGNKIPQESSQKFYVQKRDGSTDLLDEAKVRKDTH